ncbi:ABC transporter ATP-binding protein [Luteibacter sp. 3190]|uniref:ABC transporter ATP-binding protein n=1 Tax=Luteibacter sp. 3190 TaxID=2817736 RepID=UPI0028569932|nr:ABC transporter ATP-binding protein [Luteibacter sp. 3190]MDR6936856.1 lipopolysaccharide transport system ATP-binding protein [Luteibacter sp. 3190]
MSSDDFALIADSLSKRYEIYESPRDRLKQMIVPRLRRMIGLAPKTYYRDFWALRSVSVDIRRGETVGIIGANGSGKSTFLQLVCGTLSPTEGRVKAFGRVAALLELGAGFNPEFTGEENVYLSGLLYGIPEVTLRERFESIVAFSEIGEFIHQPVKTYSSGMYVRLAFAIVAHVDADTLIIDEALSVGDIRFTQKCMRFLREFQRRGTLLFVSHDSAAILGLCSRAVWLSHGEVRMDGPSREVMERYLAFQHAADRDGKDDGPMVTLSPVAEGSAEGKSRPASDVLDVKDFRLEKWREAGPVNVIEVFDFAEPDGAASFGAGKALITEVGLRDVATGSKELFEGGELVELTIRAEVKDSLESPIFGFYVKDRLGQRLFGDNTYGVHRDSIGQAGPASILSATFRFRFPVLPAGAYSVDVALATGTQDDHTQQHWIHDAIHFRASESTMRSGLVGVPMLSIDLDKSEG